MTEALTWADDALAKSGFITGSANFTVADISLFSSYTTLVASAAFDVSPFKNLAAWCERMKKLLPCHEKVNTEGAKVMGQWIKDNYKP